MKQRKHDFSLWFELNFRTCVSPQCPFVTPVPFDFTLTIVYWPWHVCPLKCETDSSFTVWVTFITGSVNKLLTYATFVHTYFKMLMLNHTCVLLFWFLVIQAYLSFSQLMIYNLVGDHCMKSQIAPDSRWRPV